MGSSSGEHLVMHRCQGYVMVANRLVLCFVPVTLNASVAWWWWYLLGDEIFVCC